MTTRCSRANTGSCSSKLAQQPDRPWTNTSGWASEALSGPSSIVLTTRAVHGQPALARAPVDVQPRRAPHRPVGGGLGGRDPHRALDRGGTHDTESTPRGRPLTSARRRSAEMAPVRSRPTAGEQTGRRRSRLLEDDLVRRDRAERTRRAYRSDLQELARWAAAEGLAPRDIGPREVRRYVAHLSAAGWHRAPRRASWPPRGRCSTACASTATSQQNPGELVSTPRRGRHLPRVLSSREAGRLLDAIPATSPLELRDRAMFELAYSCGLRAEELVSLDDGDLDFDAEQVRVEGKGRKTRLVPVGEPAQKALRDYLERGRRPLAAQAGPAGAACDVPQHARAAALDQRRAAPVEGVGLAAPGSSRASRPTPCATASPPTCSTAAPTCAASRRCSATRASPRPRSTRAWSPPG